MTHEYLLRLTAEARLCYEVWAVRRRDDCLATRRTLWGRWLHGADAMKHVPTFALGVIAVTARKCSAWVTAVRGSCPALAPPAWATAAGTSNNGRRKVDFMLHCTSSVRQRRRVQCRPESEVRLAGYCRLRERRQTSSLDISVRVVMFSLATATACLPVVLLTRRSWLKSSKMRAVDTALECMGTARPPIVEPRPPLWLFRTSTMRRTSRRRWAVDDVGQGR